MAFHLLRKYQNKLCTFNDDIQDTASVVHGDLPVAVPLPGKPISEQNFIFLGHRRSALQRLKLPYAHDAPEYPNLFETLDRIKTTALTGVCTITKAFNETGIWYQGSTDKHPRIVVPNVVALKHRIIAEVHNTNFGRNPGATART
ncbi:hypothetical protein PF005_g20793 [Phytophthora fragariae]|nr:hypothetical protein PF010_g23857 [Phytophthora fragariae]KAE9186592.1 hypothetical protein PF005_g20793 [Phytophthora fragariae]